MEQRDELRAIQLQQLRAPMDRSLAESARGEGAVGDQFMRDMLTTL